MKYTYLSLLIISALSVSSCQDDDSAPLKQLDEKTYSADSGLELFYNGASMPSKSVSFRQNGDKAHVKVYSMFDLSRLGNGMKGEIPAPGAIPGSPVTEWDVKLSPSDGYWEFEGEGSDDYCQYDYQGFASADKMKLFLNDVILKSGGVKPEIWQPSPIKNSAPGTYESLPFYIDWKYDPLPGIDINLSPVVEALATIPVIPVYDNTAYMSVSEAVSLVLKTVAFKPDGNMIFSYVSTAFGAQQLAQTEPNRFQYVIASPSTVKLYLDPMSVASLILVNASGSTPPSEVDLTDKGLFPSGKNASGESGKETPELKLLREKIMTSAMNYFLPRLATGLTLDFKITGSSLDVYIDTPMAVDLFENILLPLIKEDSAAEAIEKYIAGIPALAPILPDLQKILPLLPKAFEQTNSLRLGFSFVPYSK